jgi:uncharacterized membrane protein (UPF0127 family)
MYNQNLRRILGKVLLMTVFCHSLAPPVLSEDFSLPAKSETERFMHKLKFLKPGNAEDVTIQIEIADTPPAHSAGLQGRVGLGKDAGMLFVFPKEALLKFWMKKTLIPLDIIYVSKDHQIVDIISEAQPCTESSCTIYPSTRKCLYAIEVNAGFTIMNDIRVGDKVEF